MQLNRIWVQDNDGTVVSLDCTKIVMDHYDCDGYKDGGSVWVN